MSNESNVLPFYFALPSWANAETRAKAPDHVAATYGARGRIEYVRSEYGYMLYRVVAA